MIDICLNSMYSSAARTTGASAFSLWCRLLRTCYREFGHVATAFQCRGVSPRHYWRNERDFRYVEALAIDWANRRLAELRDRNARLAQPANLSGYVGARFCRWLNSINALEAEEVRIIRIKEWRCRKTGGQFSAGDVLDALGISIAVYPSAYRLLRTVSDEIGVTYIDQAGRHHKLYVWGDIPLLGTRLVQTGKLVRTAPTPPPHDWSDEIWDQPERPDWDDDEWDAEHDLPDESWDRPDFPGWDEQDALSENSALDVA
jgi:hypothetical protein